MAGLCVDVALFPIDTIKRAKEMSTDEFLELISIANRPEVSVDSLGALERELGTIEQPTE